MNTNHLKRFAREARKKLISQVAAKLDYVLSMDSAELREKANALKKLQQAINTSSKEQVIDKVAYTWFNRLMALRFMDANDFQPIGIRVVTPKDGHTLPEILDEAKQWNIANELTVKPQHIYDLLDGKIPSTNAQNEAYKELLIGACNHLNKVFPFLFERINDYAELLLPDDLTSEFSIVQDMREGMTIEDCKEVEIIGWLYQFYISENKDEVFASKTAVKKEDIPAATQLFTPRWIVEYMVQNTVGKLWLQNKPSSRLREHMPYFIESPSVKSEEYLKVNSIEEITLLDQACGSGHILVYGFELFTKIYEEEGYNPSEIPQLIIEKNLFGFEIDERAAQLAGMALMMKARTYHRRVFRKEVEPNILCYADLNLDEEDLKSTFSQIGIELSEELAHDLMNMRQATNLGSLIIPKTKNKELITLLPKLESNLNTSDVFLNLNLSQIKTAINQLLFLSKKYHCIVDNPPYMGGGAMNKELADFVKKNYPDSKADLMACFMEAGLAGLHSKGFLGMINQHSWMFLSSYEKLREKLIIETFFDTLLHLGPRTFPEIGGEVVQNASFTFWNTKSEEKGKYVRLVDVGSSELKRTKTLEAIQDPSCGWFYTANQKDFEKIPGSPIGYWLSKRFLNKFSGNLVKDFCDARTGMSTSDNKRFLRIWHEVETKKSCIDNSSRNLKWFPTQRGGGYRKWYGLNTDLINWRNDGEELKEYAAFLYTSFTRTIKNISYYFRNGISWSYITSGKLSVRQFPIGHIILNAGPACFFNSPMYQNYIQGILNSKITTEYLSILAPTLNFDSGPISKIPVKSIETNFRINDIVSDNIDLSKVEWDSRETSWDFKQNELMRIKGQDLEESYDLYQQYWKTKFFQLHQNEEELNRQFIEIYGLQEELTPDVPLEDITILKEETKIANNELEFNSKEVFTQFVSYAVGCMFGRYSLDKEGLILANQGETLQDYMLNVYVEAAIPTSGGTRGVFLPDDDNIIPILNDEWFEDDITARFYEFLKVSFGVKNFEKNLHFIEDALGKDIRKYFAKDFYADHIKRYKKRPIYWMFSSPKNSFNVLIYMHRYNQDTLNEILNGYLKEFQEKLRTQMEQLEHIQNTGSASEQTKASKEIDRLRLVLLELKEYERDVLFPLATERIPIDLDDGVLVNYNKFGTAIKAVPGLNDAKTKKKVRGFDWIDTTKII